jgi:hypothetical protein
VAWVHPRDLSVHGAGQQRLCYKKARNRWCCLGSVSKKTTEAYKGVQLEGDFAGIQYLVWKPMVLARFAVQYSDMRDPLTAAPAEVTTCIAALGADQAAAACKNRSTRPTLVLLFLGPKMRQRHMRTDASSVLWAAIEKDFEA